MDYRYEIANDLLAIKAVQINTDDYFTWTSGIKSPIYCDNRLTISYPSIRKRIAEAFVTMISEKGIEPDVIAGCATAGIPHAAWLAEELGIPMVYVRSKPKGHGNGKQIEGELLPGQQVIVIEDLVSTGGSSLNAAKALQEHGAEVIGVLSIFTYGLRQTAETFAGENIALDSITGFDQLMNVLKEAGIMDEKEKAEMLTWRDQLL
ncbi:orotate phosphoribosyltransferase [Lentibacillus sediminis]|uniref:orotate phosphoribosyltransferase n=1 Tax=Lentibacillus sediminis TaxID=1940529 RepID=UPI000C1BC9D1|nr:orotate phosphoribosyltransferase [Lentibacillus sediminis]